MQGKGVAEGRGGGKGTLQFRDSTAGFLQPLPVLVLLSCACVWRKEKPGWGADRETGNAPQQTLLPEESTYTWKVPGRICLPLTPLTALESRECACRNNQGRGRGSRFRSRPDARNRADKHPSAQNREYEGERDLPVWWENGTCRGIGPPHPPAAAGAHGQRAHTCTPQEGGMRVSV